MTGRNATRTAARVLTVAVVLTGVGIITAARGHPALATAAAFTAAIALLIVVHFLLHRETPSDD